MWSKVSRHARGYDWKWERLRIRILERDCYLCHCPDCQGGALRVTPAHEVDHIIPKAQGGQDDPANLRAINRECHKRVTMFQRGHVPREHPQIGRDGYPVRADRSPGGG